MMTLRHLSFFLTFFKTILFGRHIQKYYKVKQIIYQFLFILIIREPFLFSKITAYNTFVIKNLFDN